MTKLLSRDEFRESVFARGLISLYELYHSNAYEATRRVIVNVAAELGKLIDNSQS